VDFVGAFRSVNAALTPAGCQLSIDSLRIHRSAYRHGIAAADLIHALRHMLTKVEQDDDVTMILGRTRRVGSWRSECSTSTTTRW
jgi:hypothetical protein